MKKIVLFLFASYLAITEAAGQGVGVAGILYKSAAVTYATLDPSYTGSTDMLLSNGNLTVTKTASGVDGGSRTLTSHGSGHYYLEWTCNVTTTNHETLIGLCTSAQTPNIAIGFNATSYGIRTKFFGYCYNTSGIIAGTMYWQTGPQQFIAAADKFGFDIDLNGGVMQGYFNSVAVVGTPITIPAGTYYVCISSNSAATGDRYTLTSTAPYAIGTVPAGCSDW